MKESNINNYILFKTFKERNVTSDYISNFYSIDKRTSEKFDEVFQNSIHLYLIQKIYTKNNKVFIKLSISEKNIITKYFSKFNFSNNYFFIEAYLDELIDFFTNYKGEVGEFMIFNNKNQSLQGFLEQNLKQNYFLFSFFNLFRKQNYQYKYFEKFGNNVLRFYLESGVYQFYSAIPNWHSRTLIFER
ncbi:MULTISPECIES: hypothetical protein [unclassified Tenacibaculum]|uniref:hypothetical protein n=1 Tax=unclassified Tenacibaculum TaxID=2635139 RepID=UPI001F2F0482|nr:MULTISPECIES: hypothetical protein [unclassified Tenacibaculum]MCF2875150.1 hypothetical protein [Tenacibaculum sp. Cn5-1]MCF2935226.1 hypothetical protein [Tenacibaculum sp. Cn5-34]MCG7511332.1 hypothetical protein [Tenacibaculum sp. Cn5-46]